MWADHILEGPISWIMCASYIAITVTLGWTPLTVATYFVQTYLFSVPRARDR